MATATGRPRGAQGDVLSMAIDVDLDAATTRLSELAGRFGELVESIPDPDVRAEGLDWTLAETAVHVWKAFDYYGACLRGEVPIAPTRGPDESFTAFVARENRAQIDAEPERDPRKIAAAMRSSFDGFVQVVREVGPAGTATFAAGYTEDTTTSVCTLIGELIVHGYDIARTTGVPWKVDPAAAVLAVYSTTAALPLALDEVAAAREHIHVRIRLRHGSPFSIRIRNGRVWSEVTDERPDVHLSADPIAYLMVGYGRTNLLSQLLRGKLFAWGRKPWLLLRLPKLFLSP